MYAFLLLALPRKPYQKAASIFKAESMLSNINVGDVFFVARGASMGSGQVIPGGTQALASATLLGRICFFIHFGSLFFPRPRIGMVGMVVLMNLAR